MSNQKWTLVGSCILRSLKTSSFSQCQNKSCDCSRFSCVWHVIVVCHFAPLHLDNLTCQLTNWCLVPNDFGALCQTCCITSFSYMSHEVAICHSRCPTEWLMSWCLHRIVSSFLTCFISTFHSSNKSVRAGIAQESLQSVDSWLYWLEQIFQRQ